MKFERTRNFVYDKCVDRVNKRRIEKQLPQIAICRDDKSLVSHFFNKRCTRSNPYLINKRLINTNNEKKGVISGAVPMLGFKNEFEVLWGDEHEFMSNLYEIFKNIIFDLTSSDFKYKDDIELVLCDHIVYSKYSTLLQIKKYNNISLLKYFGIHDTMVSEKNMSNYFENALKYLYSKDNFVDLFAKALYDFANKHKDYKFFDKRLEKEFVIPFLLPLLKKYTPNSESLGLRVKKLIQNDLNSSIELINLHMSGCKPTMDVVLKKELINASSSYIVRLEKISDICDENNIHFQ